MSATIREAAISLHASLERFPWCIAVGIGIVGETSGLIVYVSRNNPQVRQNIPDVWEDFPVIFRRMSRPVPLTKAPATATTPESTEQMQPCRSDTR